MIISPRVLHLLLLLGALAIALTIASRRLVPSHAATLTPISAPAAPVTSITFRLWNADVQQPIAAHSPLVDGATINLADLPTRNLSIDIAPADPIGSLRIEFDSAVHVETYQPFSIFDENDRGLIGGALAVGPHTLTVTPYSESSGSGSPGDPVTVTFTVINSAPTSSPTNQTPYLGAPFAIPGTIQAEDFDNGGENVAYQDEETSNQGGHYRTSERVDVQDSNDAGGGYNVGWARAGEWLEYTVNVSNSDTYTIDTRVASNGNGGTFHIEFDGADRTGTIAIPNTGGWQNYQTLVVPNINLGAGQHVMRIALDTNGATGYVGNFNYVRITNSGAAPTPTPTPVPTPTPPTNGAQFYAATNGDGGGDGSLGRPWDLATALAHPARVRPGDTIWIRGGTYPAQIGTLSGTPDKPIIVRAYPGERVTIVDEFALEGQYTWYWGLEVTVPDCDRRSGCGATVVRGTGNKLINSILHDMGLNLNAYSAAVESEVYGTISYNGGWIGSDRPHGHGLYAQNSTGIKRFVDNLFLNNFNNGVQAYGSSQAQLKGFYFEGNVSAGNGVGGAGMQFTIGGGTPVEQLTLTNNFTYTPPDMETPHFNLPGDNSDITFTGNYTGGGGIPIYYLEDYEQATFTGNTLFGEDSMVWAFLNKGIDGWNWNNNTYYGPGYFLIRGGDFTTTSYLEGWQRATGLDSASTYGGARPTGKWVFVRPNAYEAGRAHIIIYNWDRSPTVSVNLSSYLAAGSQYEVKNAFDYYGAPAVSPTTYSGGSITLPMTGLSVARPQGSNAPATPASTGPEFGVFVLLKR